MFKREYECLNIFLRYADDIVVLCETVRVCCLNSSNMLMQRNRSLLVTARAAPPRRGLNDLEGCEGRLTSSSLAARHRRSECLQSSVCGQRRYPHSSVLPRSPPRAGRSAFKTSCQRDSRLESAAAEVTSPTAATATNCSTQRRGRQCFYLLLYTYPFP